MSFGYKPVKDAIVTILETVGSLQVVYPKEEKVIAQFPAACVSANGHTAEINDMAANRKSYQHIVRIYFRTDEASDPDYEDVLETVADEVIYALEHDVTLGGVAQWSLPTSGNWLFGEKEVPVRILELIVESKARVIR